MSAMVGEGKNQVEIEKEQESMLMKRYGGLKPKKKLLQQEHKYFDSADWALAKEKQQPESPAAQVLNELPPPLLEPRPMPERRISNFQTEALEKY